MIVHAYERIWPVDSGFAVRVWQQIDTLQSLGAKVHVFGTDAAMSDKRTQWGKAAVEHFQNLGIVFHRHRTHVWDPDFWIMAVWQVLCKKVGQVVWPTAGSLYYWRPNLIRKWRDVLRRERIDAAVVNYAFWHRLSTAARRCGVSSVIEMHELLSQQLDARYLLLGRSKPSDEVRDRHLREELRCLSEADAIIAINESEGRSIQRELSKPVIYLPMCLQERSVAPESRVESDILVVGSLIENNRKGLREFLEGSWPAIRARRPGTKFMVCGRVGEVVPADSGVETCLSVPDLTPYYEGAKIVLLVTVAGAGIKIKAIEALAHGCCILAHIHSVAGIPFVNGKHGIAVDHLGDLSETILQLLDDAERRRLLGSHARELFRSEHGFGRSREVVARIFE